MKLCTGKKPSSLPNKCLRGETAFPAASPFSFLFLTTLVLCAGCGKDKRSEEAARSAELQKEIDWYKAGTLILGQISDPVDGPAKFFDAKGVMRASGSFSHGKEEGIWRFFDANGTQIAKLSMKSGGMLGNGRFYYSSLVTPAVKGKLQVKFSFDNGNRAGHYTAYYPDGKTMLLAEVQAGQIQEPRSWDERGKKDDPGTSEVLIRKALASDDQFLSDLGHEEQMFMLYAKRKPVQIPKQ